MRIFLHILDLSTPAEILIETIPIKTHPSTNSAMWYLTELLDVLEMGAGAKAATAPTSIRERADVSCIFALYNCCSIEKGM